MQSKVEVHPGGDDRQPAGSAVGEGVSSRAAPSSPGVRRFALEGDQFRAIVEHSLAGIFVIQSGRFVFANHTFAEIFGHERAESLAGVAVEQVVAEGHRLHVREQLAIRLAGEASALHFQFRGRRRDGLLVEIEALGSRTLVDGAPAVMGTVLDVTARRKADEAIRESEERYAVAAQGARDGLWDWDLRRGLIYLSPRWRAQVGAGPLGDDPTAWIGRVHADDRKRVLGDVTRHLEGHSPHLETEYRLLHEDGSWRWMLARGLAVREATGKAYRMAGSQTDITDRKRTDEKLAHDALHDGLTGLPNRALFLDRLSQAMAFRRRRADYKYACLYLDIDRFKTINESLGHAAGDRLLGDIARRLATCLKPGDTLARLGGDEFTILLEDFADERDPQQIAERIAAVLGKPHDLDGTEVFATAGVGIVHGRDAYTRPEELLRDAEIAMYRAKEQGRGRAVAFEEGMHEQARALLQLETDLRRALERGELRLKFQPVVALPTGRIAGFEALCVWEHPLRGRVAPSDFIPIAEETGLILPIGAWVLREACRVARALSRPGRTPLHMAVNLSAHQLQPALLEQVREALRESGLDPRLLRLEVTESVLMSNAAQATWLLAQLRLHDVHLMLDDFGTGYSSLAYLHDYRFDALKIDRSFVARMASGRPAEIIRSIVSLARALGMEVVAEGVEQQGQADGLRELGVELAQGYHFSRPLAADRLEALLQAPLPVRAPGL